MAGSFLIHFRFTSQQQCYIFFKGGHAGTTRCVCMYVARLAPDFMQMLKDLGPTAPRTCKEWLLYQQWLLQPVIHLSPVSDSSRYRARAPAPLQSG